MLRAGEMIFFKWYVLNIVLAVYITLFQVFLFDVFFFIPDLLFYLDWKDIWIPSQFFSRCLAFNYLSAFFSFFHLPVSLCACVNNVCYRFRGGERCGRCGGALLAFSGCIWIEWALLWSRDPFALCLPGSPLCPWDPGDIFLKCRLATNADGGVWSHSCSPPRAAHGLNITVLCAYIRRCIELDLVPVLRCVF